MSEDHVYHLSSLDQSMPRSYIRYCLCYPCDQSQVSSALAKLGAAVQRVLAHLPILACAVQPVHPTDPGAQKGRLEVRLSREDLAISHAMVRRARLFQSYQDLATMRVPPAELVLEALTPLPDAPDPEAKAPVFAVQANVLNGGLLVALYLHHSVADIQGLAQVMRLMSLPGPACGADYEMLRADARRESRAREQLSHAEGAERQLSGNAEYDSRAASKLASRSLLTGSEKGDTRVFGFDLAAIQQLRGKLNRFSRHDELRGISPFSCLAAVLWKAISRASYPNGPGENDTGRLLKLTIPVGVWRRVKDMPENYFGNAIVHAETHSRILELNKPYDTESLAHVANLVRIATARIKEPVVRSKIGSLNAMEDVSQTSISNLTPDTNLVITSWTALPASEEEAGLGLGLGAPQWARKIGRTFSGYGCIMLPSSANERAHQVQITLSEEVMGRLVKDEGFMKIVKWVA